MMVQLQTDYIHLQSYPQNLQLARVAEGKSSGEPQKISAALLVGVGKTVVCPTGPSRGLKPQAIFCGGVEVVDNGNRELSLDRIHSVAEVSMRDDERDVPYRQ